ncbi:hypothetical protein [Clostridium sp. UBA1353]|uniref:hypothetical protein n=1 Tax=Clostridium sp. UBA1353 TaxID=1946347 RepID=UPI0032165FAD
MLYIVYGFIGLLVYYFVTVIFGGDSGIGILAAIIIVCTIIIIEKLNDIKTKLDGKDK